MRFFRIWILLIWIYVWIALRENKPDILRRSRQLFEIVHTDFMFLCCSILCWRKYVITFIDDFSLYGLHDKYQSIDVLELCINEVRGK